LKNDGVKVNGKDDIPYEVENIKIHGLKPPSSINTTKFRQIPILCGLQHLTIPVPRRKHFQISAGANTFDTIN
jgi:hypothetical protein